MNAAQTIGQMEGVVNVLMELYMVPALIMHVNLGLVHQVKTVKMAIVVHMKLIYQTADNAHP